MEERNKKRFKISFFYLAVVSLFFFLVYYFFLRSEETCFDRVKNQNEIKVDCGGVCDDCPSEISAQDLMADKSGFLANGSAGKYDFWGKIKNPNSLFGASSFDYEIVFRNSTGETVGRKAGRSFILPGEEKHLVEIGIPAEDPVGVSFSFSNVSWVEFIDYYERPQLKVVNKNYKEITSGAGFSEARGVLKNESPFDFNIIRLGVILKNDRDEVVAVNSTEMRTVISREEREFLVMWPVKFSGSVEKMEAFPEIDIFDSEAFFKRSFGDQRL